MFIFLLKFAHSVKVTIEIYLSLPSMRLLSNILASAVLVASVLGKKQEDVGMCSSFDLNSHQSAKLLLQLTRLSDITHIAKQMLKNSFKKI